MYTRLFLHLRPGRPERSGQGAAFALVNMSRLHVIVGLSLALTATLAQNYAVANMRSAKGGSSISGTVTFEQSVDDARGDMTVTYSITGLPSDGLKGFHVHQYGDTRFTETLKTMDAHFVPFCTTEFVCNDGTTTCSEGSDEGRYCCPKVSPEVGCEDDDKHGLPPSAQRQPGDMGNINVVDGVAAATLILGQKKMSLTDPTRSIVGRVVVVHSNEDDGSQPYGAAGAPMAYGVIGLGNPTTMAVPRTVNVARAPSVPKADKLACTFETSSVSKIYGDALLTLQEPCDPGSCTARMQVPSAPLPRPAPPHPRSRANPPCSAQTRAPPAPTLPVPPLYKPAPHVPSAPCTPPYPCPRAPPRTLRAAGEAVRHDGGRVALVPLSHVGRHDSRHHAGGQAG